MATGSWEEAKEAGSLLFYSPSCLFRVFSAYQTTVNAKRIPCGRLSESVWGWCCPPPCPLSHLSVFLSWSRGRKAQTKIMNNLTRGSRKTGDRNHLCDMQLASPSQMPPREIIPSATASLHFMPDLQRDNVAHIYSNFISKHAVNDFIICKYFFKRCQVLLKYSVFMAYWNQERVNNWALLAW